MRIEEIDALSKVGILSSFVQISDIGRNTSVVIEKLAKEQSLVLLKSSTPVAMIVAIEEMQRMKDLMTKSNNYIEALETEIAVLQGEISLASETPRKLSDILDHL